MSDTTITLTNCEHLDAGWCLKCVRNLVVENARLRFAIDSAVEQAQSESHDMYRTTGTPKPFFQTLCDAMDCDGQAERCCMDLQDAAILRLTEENAALRKQWNDLDQRNEKRHREWLKIQASLTEAFLEARRAAAIIYSKVHDPDPEWCDRWPWLGEEGEP